MWLGMRIGEERRAVQDAEQGGRREGGLPGGMRLLHAGEGFGLHDVDGLRIMEFPAEDGDEFVQGVFYGVGTAVAVPKADEACERMDVGVLHGCAEVALEGSRGKVAGEDEGDFVFQDGVFPAGGAGSGDGEGGGLGQAEIEAEIVGVEAGEAIWIAGGEAMQEVPLGGEAAVERCGGGEGAGVSRWWRWWRCAGHRWVELPVAAEVRQSRGWRRSR